MSDHPLDDPVRAALLGPHAGLAERRGDVLRYPPDVAPFLSLPASGDPSEDPWPDVARLIGPRGTATTAGAVPTPPPGWEQVGDIPGVQLVDDGAEGRRDPDAEILGPADVPEMLALVARTHPGPFRDRTIALGTYLGLRRDFALVAMAGERMHLPGWTEISAVCTDPGHRGQGLAARLVRDLVARIRARDEQPFLHAAASNAGAIALYERLGFRLRARPSFVTVRAPAAVPSTVPA